MSLRITSLALTATAVVLVAVLQFLPWASVESEGSTTPGMSYYGFTSPGFTIPGFEVIADTWGLEFRSDGSQSDEGWYSSEFDDGDDGTDSGVVLIRIAIPFLLAGLLVLGAALLVTFLKPGAAGPALALAGGVLAIVGTVLFANGVDEVFEGNDYGWMAGLFVAVAACAVALAAGVTGLVGNRTSAGAPTT